MRIDQYRTEQFADEADRAAYMRMIQREAYRNQEERETQREIENDILQRAATISPDDRDYPHVSAVADQIRDHRENGNYTTCHR